jgi:hypothetical protein
VDSLFEDPNLKTIQYWRCTTRTATRVDHQFTQKLPEVHTALKGLRTIADKYNAVLIGETWTVDVAQLKQYHGAGNDGAADAHGFDADGRNQYVSRASNREVRSDRAGLERERDKNANDHAVVTESRNIGGKSLAGAFRRIHRGSQALALPFEDFFS